jgi:hypothetical protein
LREFLSARRAIDYRTLFTDEVTVGIGVGIGFVFLEIEKFNLATSRVRTITFCVDSG